jgi:hypothetical protein
MSVIEKSKVCIGTRLEKGTLRVLTKNPEKALTVIISGIKDLKEELSYINVSSASLDDVFVSIWKGARGERK